MSVNTITFAQGSAEAVTSIEMSYNFAVNSPEALGQDAFAVVEQIFNEFSNLDNLNSTEVEILKNYTFALQRLGRTFGISGGESPFTVPTSITDFLRELIHVSDTELAYNAGFALALLTPKDANLERYFLDVLFQRADMSALNLSEIIQVLNWRPILTQEYELWLVKQVAEAQAYGTAEAAALSFDDEGFPPGLREAIIGRLRDPANFANINLLLMLVQSGVTSDLRADLVEMRRTLESERLLNQSQRRVRFGNTDRTIAQLSQIIETIDAGTTSP